MRSSFSAEGTSYGGRGAGGEEKCPLYCRLDFPDRRVVARSCPPHDLAQLALWRPAGAMPDGVPEHTVLPGGLNLLPPAQPVTDHCTLHLGTLNILVHK